MLSRSSKNNWRPSATFSSVIGLSGGIAIASYVVSPAGSGWISGVNASDVGTAFRWQPTMNAAARTSRLKLISRNFRVLMSPDSYIGVRKCLDGFSFKLINVYSASRMRTPKRWLGLFVILVCSACSGGNENAHTTATTIVSPPPRQVLKVESRPGKQVPAKPDDPNKRVNGNEPLLIFNFVDDTIFPVPSEVVINFSLANAKLKGDGGEFRVRYYVDDDDARWIDRWEDVSLTGWTTGHHTIRLELIGPDGWPYRNGDYNIETRKLEFR